MFSILTSKTLSPSHRAVFPPHSARRSMTHIQPKNSRDYEIKLGWVDITCGPVYILAVQAGCSSVSGPISQSIQGEEATKTSTREGNRTGYAKYSLHRLVIQVLLTIGSSFRNLIHKARVRDILGIVHRHRFLNVRVKISSTL